MAKEKLTKEEQEVKDAMTAKAEEDADADVEDDEAEEEDDDKNIDYEAELKTERERADKAEKALADRAFKERDNKRKGKDEDDEEDDDEDKPLTSRELQKILAENHKTTLKEINANKALDIARANTSSEAEALAAVEFYKNRVNPTGNLEDDILFAIGGLNRKKVVGQNNELKRALRSKENASGDAIGTQRDGPKEITIKASKEIRTIMTQQGYAEDKASGFFKKPVKGNKTKFNYFDPKTKRNWIA